MWQLACWAPHRLSASCQNYSHPHWPCHLSATDSVCVHTRQGVAASCANTNAIVERIGGACRKHAKCQCCHAEAGKQRVHACGCGRLHRRICSSGANTPICRHAACTCATDTALALRFAMPATVRSARSCSSGLPCSIQHYVEALRCTDMSQEFPSPGTHTSRHGQCSCARSTAQQHGGQHTCMSAHICFRMTFTPCSCNPTAFGEGILSFKTQAVDWRPTQGRSACTWAT